MPTRCNHRLAALLALSLIFFSALHAQDSHVNASLVSEQETIVPGETFWVALRQEIAPHWHTYYREPGDSGLKTRIKWDLPEGFSTGEIHWPEPKEYVDGPLTTYIYENEVLLMVPIQAPDSLKPGSEITLQADVSWLECKEICLPGKAQVNLKLPVSNAPARMNERWESAFENTRQHWDAQARASQGLENPREEESNNSPAAKAEQSLLYLGLLALLGGLILNLMPCVFPVIGLKIMSFVNQAGHERAHIIRHGLIFTLGILISFWVLAAIFISLREAGESVGWGFQMQNPDVVVTLTFVFLLVGMNLLGAFEIGSSLTGAGGSLASKQGASGTFFSGVLATVAATPCSAPFLVTALSATLDMPALPTLYIFTMIALGLALPYLLLSAVPQAVNKLPKPGPWMESLKQGLAFLLFGTVAYLIWIAAGLLNETHLRDLLLALIGIAMTGWIYGRWVQRRSGRAKGIGAAIALLLLALSLYGAYRPHASFWQPWSPERVAELRSQGKPIYIDFTARWCATCQYNKAVVFSSEKVLQAFKERGVVALKADYTHESPEITRALEKYGRNAIPTNVLYLPGKTEPVVLPVVLTPEIVLQALRDKSSQQ